MKITPEMRNSPQFARRRALLVPICLCLVAGFHAYRVFACGQTAWKGGGFGMFSTIDGENARFVKAYLLSEQGELPIAIPTPLRKRLAELRAAPNQTLTAELAGKLARQNWQDAQAKWSRIAERAFTAGEQPVSATLFQSPASNEFAVGNYRPTGSVTPVEPLLGNDAALEIPFREVRVEVWRYRYHEPASMLFTEQLFTATQPREER